MQVQVLTLFVLQVAEVVLQLPVPVLHLTQVEVVELEQLLQSHLLLQQEQVAEAEAEVSLVMLMVVLQTLVEVLVLRFNQELMDLMPQLLLAVVVEALEVEPQVPVVMVEQVL